MPYLKTGLRCAVLLACLASAGACMDVGDSSAVPGSEDAAGSTFVVDAGSDAAPAADSAATPPRMDAAASTDAGNDNVPGADAASSMQPDAQSAEADAFAEDAHGADATVEDATISDASVADVTLSSLDAGSPADAATTEDSTAEDAASEGQPDATIEAGEPDAASMDAAEEIESDAAQDATVADAAVADAGKDAAEDTGSVGGGPSACTTSPCNATGPNSVLCDGDQAGGVLGLPSNVCTQTQALLVNRQLTAAGAGAQALLMPAPPSLGTIGQVFTDWSGSANPGTTSCYECMVNFSCGDDNVFLDTANECDDLASAPPAIDGEPAVQACLDVVDCAFAQHCVTQNPPSACFCGTAAGSACLAANAANGPCLAQEINGLDFTTGGLPAAQALDNQGTCTTGSFAAGGTPPTCTEGDGTNSQKQYADKLLPAGNANYMLGCLQLNCATLCQLP